MLATLAMLSAWGRTLPVTLHVEGTRIVDGAGHEIRFHGINIPSLEWDANGDHVPQSVKVALDDWHANLIRVPLSEDRWFGKAPDSKDDGTSYRAIVASVVGAVTARSKHVLLDLHWSNAGVWGQNIGQHNLPDVGSMAFWKSCAKQFGNQPAVIFDLYNEPIKGPWETWRDGGEVTEDFNGKSLTYQAVGLQQLLDAIRLVGAKNVVVAGGLGYSSQMDGLSTHGLVDKTGNGVVYANHFYPGWESVDSWEKRISVATKTLPVIVGEFGADPQSLPLDDPQRRAAQVLAVLKKHDWNWCAWCMHPAATPCLIKDWTYAPTTYFGDLVKEALLGHDVPIPPQPTTGADKVVYDDELKDGFQSWSSAKVNLSAGSAHSGTHSIQVDAGSGQQLMLGTIPFDGEPYSGISFWLNGGESGGQKLVLQANIMDAGQATVALPALEAGKWVHITISFNDLGIDHAENVKSFSIRAADGLATPTYFVDDVTVIGRH